MKIDIKDPFFGKHWICEAEACTNESEKGWSVVLPSGNSVFLVLQQEVWKVRHDDTVQPEMCKAIGAAIAVAIHAVKKAKNCNQCNHSGSYPCG